MVKTKIYLKFLYVAIIAIYLFSIESSINLSAQTKGDSYDLIIKNGKIMDGTGNPYFYGDVGVIDDKIVFVGNLSDASAGRIIDASGTIVAPGFIDIHSHGEEALINDDKRFRAAPNVVLQGVTTIVTSNCGRFRSNLSIEDHIAEMRAKEIGPNALVLVGHNDIREEVMGEDYQRPATEEEIEQMRALVRQGMEEGASGMSVGLEYGAGIWSTTEEVIALVEEIVPFGGVFQNHPRAQGDLPKWFFPSQHELPQPSVRDAVREHLEIGEKTGATVVYSHIKARGRPVWGSSENIIRLFEDARARGVNAYSELYPYNTSGSDGRDPVIPLWLDDHKRDTENYRELLSRFIDDPEKEEMILMDIEHEINRRGGAETLTLVDHPNDDFVGKTLKELAEKKDISNVDMVIRLQMEGYPEVFGGVSIRGYSMSEYDVENFIKQPWTATGSDSFIRVSELDDDPDHHRIYGTFPRMIRVYAMEREVITVEEAIRSMTSLPAQIHNIRDRGQIREGMKADIVVFDPGEIRDKATPLEPTRYSEGIEYLLINGVFTVDEGELTLNLPGVVITP